MKLSSATLEWHTNKHFGHDYKTLPHLNEQIHTLEMVAE